MENLVSHETVGGTLSAGAELRKAREAAGLSRADIATHTKIAERHLLAIEEDRLGDLAARTYAVGFARAYARAVSLDEKRIADKVRRQLDAENWDKPAVAPSFEPGDPARVPTLRLAWVAGGALVVVIGLLLAFWSSFLSPEGELPSLLPDETAKVAQQPAVRPVPVKPAAPPVAGAPVVLTATANEVWIKVTDAAGQQIVQKELALNESWTVPAGTGVAMLRTGRPDALRITVGGRALPALSARPEVLSGVSLAPADLLARFAPKPVTRIGSSGGAAAGSGPATRPVEVPAPSQGNSGGAPAVDPAASAPIPETPASPLSTVSD